MEEDIGDEGEIMTFCRSPFYRYQNLLSAPKLVYIFLGRVRRMILKNLFLHFTQLSFFRVLNSFSDLRKLGSRVHRADPCFSRDYVELWQAGEKLLKMESTKKK